MQKFCDNESIPADGVTRSYLLGNDHGSMSRYDSGVIAVDLDVGAGTEQVAFGLQAADSADGTWHDVLLTDLTATGAVTLAATITLDADAEQIIARVEDFYKFIRLRVTNDGDNAATLSAAFMR